MNSLTYTSNSTKTNDKLNLSDYVQIRTGIIEPEANEGEASKDIILTVNTRDINVYVHYS